MRVKVELEENETLEEAEERLEKALKMKRQARKEYFDRERYADQHVEDFHQEIMKEHEELLEKLAEDITQEIEKDIQRS